MVQTMALCQRKAQAMPLQSKDLDSCLQICLLEAIAADEHMHMSTRLLQLRMSPPACAASGEPSWQSGAAWHTAQPAAPAPPLASALQPPCLLLLQLAR